MQIAKMLKPGTPAKQNCWRAQREALLGFARRQKRERDREREERLEAYDGSA